MLALLTSMSSFADIFECDELINGQKRSKAKYEVGDAKLEIEFNAYGNSPWVNLDGDVNGYKFYAYFAGDSIKSSEDDLIISAKNEMTWYPGCLMDADFGTPCKTRSKIKFNKKTNELYVEKSSKDSIFGRMKVDYSFVVKCSTL